MKEKRSRTREKSNQKHSIKYKFIIYYYINTYIIPCSCLYTF